MASFSGLMRVFVHRTAAPEGTLYDTAGTDKCRTGRRRAHALYKKTLIIHNFKHQACTCAFLDLSILGAV